ncbi:uncharacterized protein LOC111681566 [Lucilia cuprina]|uniref:uncharacterized protein LOC111681566 n=1 Tax=Lucilia cuprina TaxID=7375 RepID=UPI001F06CBD4|nr:uncharacterized protein LOC111681566 [Lucilia cuprina]
MHILQFLAILYLILSQINCTVLQPRNQTKLKLAKSSNSENTERDEIHFNNISHENSDEIEQYLFNYCKDEEYLHKFISHDNKTQMIWVTWNRTKAGERAILPNICSVKNGLPLRRRCYSDMIGTKWENYDNKTVLIDCRISMFCQAEAFQHYIIENNGELALHQNSWKRAKIGEYSSLRDLCLQPNGLHLTRKCFYDYKQQRAKWSSIEHLKDFKCLQHTRQELISKELNSLHGNMTASNFLVRDMSTRRQTATTLLSLLEKPKVKLLPADVQLTTEILKNIVTDSQDIEISRDVLKITHNLMATDPVVLRMSAEVNATNSLLETFENYMDALTEKLVSDSHCQVKLPVDSLPVTNNNDTSVEILNLSNMGVYGHITRNISVFFVNPNCSNISGIVVYDSYQLNNQSKQQQLQNQIYYDSLNDFHYRFIFMNESINEILQETNIELASFIPTDMWYSLHHKSYPSLQYTPVVVFKIYAHDGLFVEQNLLRSRKPFSKILSISLPGFTGEFRPKHYIIKSAIIAWGLPLVPTLLVALLDSKSYIPSNYQLATDTGICYPSGNGLHFGVILPVSLIVLANLAIFLYVFYSISRTLSMSMQRNEKQMVIKQIRLSILLFFLLGLSWIFGIFAFMKAGIVFSYLFCLTATLQGFVLFIYFVIIDENSRSSWQKLLCPTCLLMLPFIVITILACIAAGEVCKKEIENIILVNGSDELTSIIIWFPANISTYNTYNICSESTGKRLERTCSKEDGSVKWVDNNKSIKYVNCTQTNKCADETLELFYRNEKNELEKYLNKWLSAEAEEIGFLEKPCYLKTGLLTRKCKYNSNTHKTLWEKSDKEKENLVCWEKEYSEQKQNKMLNKENLFTLSQDVADVKLYKTNPKDAIAKSIKFLKSDDEKRTPTHIDAIRNILKAILDQTETPELVPDILNLTNTLMQTDADVIRDSKCANEIFSTMDSYLNNMAKQLVPTDKCESINDGIYMATVSMASLFFINPLCSNISGMAIFNSDNSSALKRLYDQHSNNYYQFIYLNQSLDKLLAEPGLEVATYLPIDLWNSIISKTGTKNDTILKIMLLKNDVLFVNLTIMKQKPIDSVLEITLIDYKEKLPSALPFIFNNTRNKKNAKPKCGFWNKTTWITTGTNTSYVINSYNEELLLCNTSHLTPFSVLLNLEIMDTFNDSALDMISVLGCSLSLFGLICIWLTAVCFPKWREHSTNKVLLNICFVLTLIMIFFVLLNIPDIKSVIFDINNYTHCLITGAFLQYIVLVLFMWMLFIAVLQYQRFVKVYNTDMGGNFIRKFFIVSWGLPLIPTFLLVRYKPDAYMPNAQSKAENTAICYPSGYGFYLGVMLPITLIIIANVSIFANIILKLLLSNIEFKNQRTRKQKLRQVYLSILLFFLLGISWIFGMLAHLESSPVFSYIFCLTSTLQGFVMFIYFIVINKTTRSIWRNLICGIQNSQQERVL